MFSGMEYLETFQIKSCNHKPILQNLNIFA